MESERDPYSRKNAELLKYYITQVDLLAPVIPGELEVRKKELGELAREITELSRTHEIDLPALQEAFQRGPQPVEPTVEFEQR